MICSRLIIDGNAVYEIDEECLKKLCREETSGERGKEEREQKKSRYGTKA